MVVSPHIGTPELLDQDADDADEEDEVHLETVYTTNQSPWKQLTHDSSVTMETINTNQSPWKQLTHDSSVIMETFNTRPISHHGNS